VQGKALKPGKIYGLTQVECCVNAAVPATNKCTGNTNGQPIGWLVPPLVDTTRDFKCPDGFESDAKMSDLLIHSPNVS
jgi:hypothetical protein